MNRFRLRGFTLIELMIAVVVLSILSVVAVVSYSKYVRKARTNDVISFLADIKIKQETYFSQYGHYVDTTAASGASYGDSDFYPSSIAGGEKPWAIHCPADQLTYPGWCSLGAHPGSDTVDYQYVTVGWAPDDPNPPADLISNPQRRWWYAIGRGDTDSNGVYASFVFSSELKEIMVFNETE